MFATKASPRRFAPALRGKRVKRSFELCIEAGAHMVSIESIGGKELHDPGLMYGDIRAIVFALGVLAPRDTAWLWDQISAMCAANGSSIPAGDSACGFANTAMQLAHQQHAAGGAGGGGAGDERRAQPGRLRTRRGGPVEGLRLRRAHHQSHHRLPDFHGRQVGFLRALQPDRQYRVRHVRSLEQRVGTECSFAVGQCARGLYRDSRVRLPSDERRVRQGRSPPVARLADGIRRVAEPASRGALRRRRP